MTYRHLLLVTFQWALVSGVDLRFAEVVHGRWFRTLHYPLITLRRLIGKTPRQDNPMRTELTQNLEHLWPLGKNLTMHWKII